MHTLDVYDNDSIMCTDYILWGLLLWSVLKNMLCCWKLYEKCVSNFYVIVSILWWMFMVLALMLHLQHFLNICVHGGGGLTLQLFPFDATDLLLLLYSTIVNISVSLFSLFKRLTGFFGLGQMFQAHLRCSCTSNITEKLKWQKQFIYTKL